MTFTSHFLSFPNNTGSFDKTYGNNVDKDDECDIIELKHIDLEHKF